MKFRAPDKHEDKHHSKGWSHGLGKYHPSLSVFTQEQCGNGASVRLLSWKSGLTATNLSALCLLVLRAIAGFYHLFASMLPFLLCCQPVAGGFVRANLVCGRWVMSAVGSGTWRLWFRITALLHILHSCLTTWGWTSFKGGLVLSW